MSDWKAAYLAYDDDALTALANVGLVRRASKLAVDAAWVDERISVGGQLVTLDEHGPDKGRCPCPTAGVCTHVLAAAMFVRDEAQSAGLDAHAVTAPAGSEASEGSAPRTPETPERTGTGTGTQTARGSGSDARSSTSRKPTRRDSNQTSVTAAARLEIEALVRAGLSHVSEDASGRIAGIGIDARNAGLPLLSRHLASASALLSGLWEHRDDVSEREVLESLAKAWCLCEALDAAGAGLTPAAPHPADLTSCPTSSLPSTSGSSSASESPVVAEPTGIPPFDASTPCADSTRSERLNRLRGVVRREFSETEGSLTLLPLGASWWVSSSGARGVTLTAWDEEENDVRTATSARPAGVDPRFIRSPSLIALWNATISTLLSGPFRVDGPRFSADGTLSSTAAKLVLVSQGFDTAALDRISDRLAPDTVGVDFGQSVSDASLIKTEGLGQILIDEPTQQLVWSVPVSNGTRILHQEIIPATAHRVDAILAWQEARAKVEYILARRAVIRGTAVWEPATLFRRDHGKLVLTTLDFHQAPEIRTKNALQKRWAMLTRRWSVEPQLPQVRRAGVGIACDDLRDLFVDLAATGRLTPTREQQRQCAELAMTFDDLGMATLAAATRALTESPGTSSLLRGFHMTGRAATLASCYLSAGSTQ